MLISLFFIFRNPSYKNLQDGNIKRNIGKQRNLDDKILCQCLTDPHIGRVSGRRLPKNTKSHVLYCDEATECSHRLSHTEEDGQHANAGTHD